MQGFTSWKESFPALIKRDFLHLCVEERPISWETRYSSYQIKALKQFKSKYIVPLKTDVQNRSI